jgi:GT2 family glycosyltransferase
VVAGAAGATTCQNNFLAATCFRSRLELPAVSDGDILMTRLVELKDAEPLVSIVILNYKRRDALIKCLGSALFQEYPRIEIILVDNASNDGIRNYVRDHAPNVNLIELSQNLGACAGRNAGIREARGEIVITLDNDIFLNSAFEVRKVVRMFAERPDVHLLAFQLGDALTGKLRLREWCHPRFWKEYADKEFETNFFVEGACAYRREVFHTAGAYYEPLFIGVEGHDLALRVIDHGYRILYCPHIRALHLMSPATRTPDRPYYFYTRNYIWLAHKDFHFFDGAKFLIPKLLMMFYFTLRAKRFVAFFRGVRDGLKGLEAVRRDRTAISAKTIKYLAGLERERPNWLVRLGRHRLEPQI